VIIQAAAYSGGHKLGWRTPTEKQLGKCKAAKYAPSILDSVVPAIETNLYDFVIEVLNQLALGSCTAQAAAQALRMRLVADGYKDAPLMSRLLSYFLARYLEGEEAGDVGSQISTVFEAMARFGWCPEKVWPYDIETFAAMPDTDAFRQAHDQRAEVGINYYAIDATGSKRIDMIRKALTAGFAVTWGAPVTEQFCSTRPNGIVRKPTSKDVIAGGHAQTLIGHDDRRGAFRNLNSWGPEWCDLSLDAGVCWVDYEYLAWEYARDFFIVAQAPKGSAL
jgi:C1A family cysteine protease